MTITLYGSWFSPFARKVALALELKGLAYEHVDALTRECNAQLAELNPRVEVPVLIDDGLTIVNSSDILQYLEWRYPKPALYPASIDARVEARALERLADQRLDPIVVDCSFWHWAERADQPPEGLLARAQEDFDTVITRLEHALEMRGKPWPFGAPGLVECSWFPNLLAAPACGLELNEQRFPRTRAYLRGMRAYSIFAADAQRTKRFLKTLAQSSHERRVLFWSGERLEWLLSRGFHRWLVAEIEAGRA